MTITKQEADTLYALARALEDTGRLCSLAESDDKLEWRRKNQETQCALQDVLKQLQEPESEPTAIEALTLALETERDARGIKSTQEVKQCLNCLHYNEPLASQNCASCIHGGNVEDNFVAIGKEGGDE